MCTQMIRCMREREREKEGDKTQILTLRCTGMYKINQTLDN